MVESRLGRGPDPKVFATVRGICPLLRKNAVKNKLIISLVILILPFVHFCATYAATTERDRAIIKIAYMNGYTTALELNPDRIAELKGNEVALKKAVTAAAEQYLAVLNSMNK